MSAEFEAIYNEFDGKLRKFILRRVSDSAAMEDILQDVYLRLHSRIDTLRDEDKLQGWVYRVTRNAIVDHYRRGRVTTELPESLPWPDEADEDAARELAPSVLGMIHCLPDKYRQALILSELQGLPQQTVAERLGISLSGAKSRVQRGREKLKQALLDCCHFEFDRRGGIVSYQSRCPDCATGRQVRNC